MRGIALSPQFQQLLAVCVPIAALLISLGVVYPAWGRYGEISTRVEEQRQELNKLKNTPLPPVSRALPAADPGRGESARFLGDVVSLGLAANCRFIGLDAAATTITQAGGMLRSVRTRVEVEGDYPHVRQFLAQIAGASRLYVITALDIDARARGNRAGAPADAVRATVEIERYLVASPAPVTTTASR